MGNEELEKEWLRRARSNLERARAGKISKYVLYEDLCFDAQQCAEKSIKALLIFFHEEFPWTHSIEELLGIVSNAGTEIPEEIRKAVILTRYAVHTRYPGLAPAAERYDYKEATELAENVFRWANKIIKESKK
jgi:HEPN domain-containing protein